jgi:ribosome-associated protein
MDFEPRDTSPEPENISKTQLKREMQELQDLGKALTNLSNKQLEDFPLDNDLREALGEYQRFKHREARRRQLQFIGKLMREADREGIQKALDLTNAGSEAAKQHFHKLEQWRDRLVSEGDNALQAVMEELPGLDRQQIRQLIRQARKEQENNKPPAASRKIFKLLKEQAKQS